MAVAGWAYLLASDKGGRKLPARGKKAQKHRDEREETLPLRCREGSYGPLLPVLLCFCVVNSMRKAG
jgi:hypothetical protein